MSDWPRLVLITCAVSCTPEKGEMVREVESVAATVKEAESQNSGDPPQHARPWSCGANSF